MRQLQEAENKAQAAFDDLDLPADELALLRHHAATARGLGPGDAWVEQAARVLVPQLGREHRFLMHFVLSFAALHLARLQPDQLPRWAAAADQHLAGGLRGVAQVLPALGPANCHAVYVSACFVCFCAFARGPRRGECLLFAANDDDGDGGAAFLLLMRGVRQIVEAVGEAAVFSGPLRACPRPERADLPAGQGLHHPRRVEWAGPVGRLRAFVACSADACADAVLRAVNDLARCFGDTCGDGDDAEGGARPQEQAILAWLFRISTQDRFVECLRQKRPLALLVLAHFAVLLRMLDHVWFMAGWAGHILAAIRDIIGGEYGEQLAWPMQEVGVPG
ncbi:putative c6 zinc finger protein [Neofusicoccum parvum UCRNP2]|uniref:Putative c6 zinc finger protein n=1 Tax=Botryosphaeria parva (strain UCR-NP2) TaxID=1287680 RepID=R1GK41_BOTPV|nr:putative c6 zinc finger protein [Neofusicoccum parvum UCRNP2]